MTRGDNITLVGMPGAGKSTLGIVLAKRLGMRFVDTDLLIQEGSGMLLCDILAQEGLDAFLEYENSILAGLECCHHVIATGGSACYGKEAMEHLSQLGIIVYIDITFPEMLKRLGDYADRGIAMGEGMTIRDLYDQRAPLYRKYADIVVETSGLSTRDAVDTLMAALEANV